MGENETESERERAVAEDSITGTGNREKRKKRKTKKSPLVSLLQSYNAVSLVLVMYWRRSKRVIINSTKGCSEKTKSIYRNHYDKCSTLGIK